MGGLGCVDCRIEPLVRCHQVMVGTAVTCYTGASDGLAVFGALHAARRGDVVSWPRQTPSADTAIAGDLLLGVAREIAALPDGSPTVRSEKPRRRPLRSACGSTAPGLTANSGNTTGQGTFEMPDRGRRRCR